MSRPYRLAVVTSHPVQYQAPLFQRLAQHSCVDLSVYYGHDGSIAGAVDPEFGVPIKWDRPLLEGYRSAFLTRRRDRLNVKGERRQKARIIGELRQQQFDAVLIHSYATFLSAMAIAGARLSATPILMRTESNCLMRRSAKTETAKSLVLKTLFRGISAALVIGEANRDFYLRYGVPRRKMFFTPYCVDNEFIATKAAEWQPLRHTLRRDLGLPEDQMTIAFSGKLIELKRTADIIEAVALLRQQGIRVSLLVIGDGALREELQFRAASAGIDAAFVGFRNQTELPKFYACADALVLSSRSETWGLVVNEAMACGLPVVATDMVGAAVDLISSDSTGYQYPVGNVPSLARALSQLASNKERRQRMGEEARRRVSRYTYGHCVDGIVQALHTLERRPRNGESRAAKIGASS